MTNSITPIQNEIAELEKRLVKMDFKLETAKKARDEYVNFLQQKYPNWKPPEMQIYKQQSVLNQYQRSILDNLATNKYHWDIGRQVTASNKELELSNLEPNDPIPTGLALESDLIRIKKRLSEIAEDLKNLREHRLHLSSTDYYLSLGSSKGQQMPWKEADKSNVDLLKSFHNLRTQINQIDPCILSDTPRASAEDYERMRMEYLQKYANIAGGGGGKSDNQDEQNFEQSLTDKRKNSNLSSIGQQKGFSDLYEIQRTGKKVALGETSDLCQILDAQKGGRESSSQEMVAAKSRPIEAESISQTSHQPKTTDDDDGFNFLAKILGSSAAAAAADVSATNKKPIFSSEFNNDGMLKMVDVNDDDSDSDFFA
uniref:Uncharacterized protein n=1 Tax=Elaeophora elaphi TaxID=1147741 RepID=A0A0R3S018_9BILA